MSNSTQKSDNIKSDNMQSGAGKSPRQNERQQGGQQDQGHRESGGQQSGGEEKQGGPGHYTLGLRRRKSSVIFIFTTRHISNRRDRALSPISSESVFL